MSVVYVTNNLVILSRTVGGEEGEVSPEAENPVRSLFHRLLGAAGVKLCGGTVSGSNRY